MSATPPAFVHDLATCVGCHACVVACGLENDTAPGGFWRQVVSFNEDRRPALPVFHLSLACNHCLDAPCERHCPALAIARDARTGAVLIDGERCIGCHYCSWVCPYDAPRFEPSSGVMGKCTLCHHRLLEGGQPACVSSCPTGALKLGPFARRPARRAWLPGRRHPARDPLPAPARPPARPRRRGESRRGGRLRPGALARTAEEDLAAVRVDALCSSRPLVIAARRRGSWPRFFGGPPVRPAPFLVAGPAGLALSTLHLGRKERAWRAALNWRRSWLSREVIAVPAFLALAAAYLQLVPGSGAAGIVAAGAGLVALGCMDRVYVAMARDRRPRLDDAAALLGAAFLAGVLATLPWLVVPAGVARLVGFVDRLRLRRVPAGPGAWALALARVGLGLALPMTVALTVGLVRPAARTWPPPSPASCWTERASTTRSRSRPRAPGWQSLKGSQRAGPRSVDVLSPCRETPGVLDCGVAHSHEDTFKEECSWCASSPARRSPC